VALGGPLIANKGYAAPEAATTARRARQLCEELGDRDRLMQALYFELSTLYIGAEGQGAWPLVERFAGLTEGLLESGAHLVGRRMLALQHFHRGEFLQARDELERILELYDPNRHDALALRYGHDVVVSGWCYLCWLLWLLGLPDRALKASSKAAARGKKITHANSKAFALLMGLAMPQQFFHNPIAVKEHSLSLIEFCDQMRLPFWRAYAEVLVGWAQVELEESEGGLVRIHKGLTDLRATGTGRHLPYLLCRMAEAQAKVGQSEQAQHTIKRALLIVETSADRSWESDLHRLHGELLFSVDPRSERAEESLRKAIRIAAEQRAKALELRACTSLARLWREQDKRIQAIELLEPMYAWFSEGLGSFDLVAARSLLEDLS
jgi:predicted ATPase